MRIDDKIKDKLATKHSVCARDIEEAFDNRNGPELKEVRPRHATNPPTWWFLSRTDKGRIIKVAYLVVDGDVVVKSAYEPDMPTIIYYCNKTKTAPADI